MVQLGIVRQLMATREAKLFASVSLNFTIRGTESLHP